MHPLVKHRRITGKRKLKKIITSRGDNIKQAVDKIINKCRDELEHQTIKDETNLKETKEQLRTDKIEKAAIQRTENQNVR